MSEDTHAGQGPGPPRKLNRQQQRVNDVEAATFRSRGVDPPPPAAIATWLSLVDEAELEGIVDDLESSGKLAHFHGKELSTYIFGCVKKFAADRAAFNKRVGAPS